MAVIVDPDFVLALARRRHPRHDEAVALVATLDEDLVTSPLAVADIDRAIAELAGLTTASLVALAARVNTRRIATFDEQFRTLTTPDGEAFVVLPADR